jgi:hypothetical protein
VLNDEWLAQAFRQPLAHQAHDNVGRAAGTSGYDPAHRPRRIGLRPRHDRQRGSARSQTQECAAGKFSWRRLLFGLFIKRRPVQVAALLRTIKGLTADDMARLARLAQKAKEK